MRTTVLVGTVALAAGETGWLAAAVFGTWAVLDGAAVLGSAFRRYDEGSSWGWTFAEGMAQFGLGAFAWLWWGTPQSSAGELFAMLLLLGSLAVLAGDVLVAWNRADTRISPGAAGAAVFAAVALTLGSPSPGELTTAMIAYAGVFAAVAMARFIGLADRAPGPARHLSLPAGLWIPMLLATTMTGAAAGLVLR